MDRLDMKDEFARARAEDREEMRRHFEVMTFGDLDRRVRKLEEGRPS